jgi:hypothetical protein
MATLQEIYSSTLIKELLEEKFDIIKKEVILEVINDFAKHNAHSIRDLEACEDYATEYVNSYSLSIC